MAIKPKKVSKKPKPVKGLLNPPFPRFDKNMKKPKRNPSQEISFANFQPLLVFSINTGLIRKPQFGQAVA